MMGKQRLAADARLARFLVADQFSIFPSVIFRCRGISFCANLKSAQSHVGGWNDCFGIGLASDNKQNGLLPLRRVIQRRMLAVAQVHGGWIEGRGDT